MSRVGIRQFKDQLADYIRRARAGERVTITDRDVPVAILIAAEQASEAQRGWQLVRDGSASWSGGKPAGSARPARTKGRSIAEKAMEDRR
jgi:prevent-host-death family protein